MTVESETRRLVRDALAAHSFVKTGTVGAIRVEGGIRIYVVDDRPMLMVGPAAIGDTVVWVDQANPIGLGKIDTP